MTHRLECAGDDCSEGCPCRCHDRCGEWMPNARERCYRLRGHRHEHRSRYALENAR